MRIWHRAGLAVAAFIAGGDAHLAKRAAGSMGARWSAAFSEDPELAADIIRLSGLLTLTPDQIDGAGLIAPRDPLREAEMRGARDLALKLLAAGHMTQDEINDLMEASE